MSPKAIRDIWTGRTWSHVTQRLGPAGAAADAEDDAAAEAAEESREDPDETFHGEGTANRGRAEKIVGRFSWLPMDPVSSS